MQKNVGYCNTVQVVWNDKLDGPNKFMEVETNLQHSRERCDAAKSGFKQYEVSGSTQYRAEYSPQQEKEFVDSYRPQQKQETQQTSDFQLAQLITKVDNLNIGIAKIMSAVSLTHDMVVALKDISLDADDISRLRTEVAELRQLAAKREDNFVPANPGTIRT